MLKFFRWKIGYLMGVEVSEIIVFFVDKHIVIQWNGREIEKYMKLNY